MLQNNYKTILLLIVLVFGLQTSCKKYETEPVEGLTKTLVYDPLDKQGANAAKVLYNIYSYLPTGFNRIDNALLDAATDDAVATTVGSNIETLSLARQTAADGIDQVWDKCYEGIHKVNEFLANIDVVPITDVTKGQWKAEARLLRAMFYFELTKRYGGVPLVGDKIFDLSSNLNISQATYDDCVQYITNECDATSGTLLKDPLSTTDVGRITQGAALSLKARTLLYAASPWHNANKDLSKWQKAADAALAVINLKAYSLNASFTGLFTNRQNTETILSVQRAKGIAIEKNNAPVGYAEPNASMGLTSPTQELVDAYELTNGLPITDNSAAIKYDPANPYANRDPRLAASVFYNGYSWLGRQVQTYNGGLDRPGGSTIQTRTGYYMRKFMGDFTTTTAYSNHDQNFIIFRYAEILLDYAEAVNELGGAANTSLALTQLVAIRKRAGLTTAATASYGLKTGLSQDDMRTAIRLERRLELAFEEHRYWDVRRWMIADQTFNKSLHGATITKVGTTGYTYQYPVIGQVAFSAPKMYLYPVPFDEILKNKALNQNPGW